MKKITSLILSSLVVATLLAGCMDIKPERVGNPDTAKTEVDVDKLLAPPTGEDFYNEGNILKVSGSAEVTHADGKTEVAKGELAVVPGDTIRVVKGTAVLHWFDDSISRLKEGTELKIDKADFNPENLTETHVGFKVVAGEVWSKVRALVDKKSEFLSQAGGVVSGVLGSTYNLIVSNEGVTVESIEHAAFVAPVDPKTGSRGKTQPLVKGQMVKAPVVKTLKSSFNVQKIPAERLAQGWVVNNDKDDKVAEKVLRQKNLERLRARAGALPGTPEYDEKMSLIQSRLKSVKNADEKARLEARVAQLKANEALVLALEKPAKGMDEVKERLDDLEKIIESSEIPESLRQKIKTQAEIELGAWDRSLEEVLPAESDLYKSKELIREKRIDLAPDYKLREEIEGNILQRQYLEWGDVAEGDATIPSDVAKEIENARLEYEKFLKTAPADMGYWFPTQAEIDQINLGIQEAIKIMPELEGQIPTIDPKILEQTQEMLKSLPQMYPTGELPTFEAPQDIQEPVLNEPLDTSGYVEPVNIDPPLAEETIQPLEPLPTIDTQNLQLLNTTFR